MPAIITPLGCLPRMPPLPLFLSPYKYPPTLHPLLPLHLLRTTRSINQSISSDMAVSGFEGFEKRLELHFSGDDPSLLGLRRLDFSTVEQILHAVQCTVVSAVGNPNFDSYVLSESSLFVYPSKIIIKTCGTTQLLQSIRPLLRHAAALRLRLSAVKYSRGSFIFPLSQPFPHTSFEDEILCIESTLPPYIPFRKASLMPSNLPSHSWHVFTAADSDPDSDSDLDRSFTIEVCMTELDKTLARKFFRRPGDAKSGDLAGKEMTEITGIGEINPKSLICDFGFDPCGYSMNGLYGDAYSTIHVTPEDGYSYASFEFVGEVGRDDVVEVLKRVVQVFRPGSMSVATTSGSHVAGREVLTRVASGLDKMGMRCRSCAVDDFPGAGSVIFQTFTPRRN